jgi:hypothetical protein
LVGVPEVSANSLPRIWLIAEHAHDDAAEILRSRGAEVMMGAPQDQPESSDRRCVVVIASSERGRALVWTCPGLRDTWGVVVDGDFVLFEPLLSTA